MPWWWWPAGFGVAALIAAEVNMGCARCPTGCPSAILFAVATGVVALAGPLGGARVTIGADDTELWAGRAHLPASVITRSASVPASAKSAALGRQLDPAVFVAHRAWVGRWCWWCSTIPMTRRRTGCSAPDIRTGCSPRCQLTQLLRAFKNYLGAASTRLSPNRSAPPRLVPRRCVDSTQPESSRSSAPRTRRCVDSTQAAQSVQIITPFFSVASLLRCWTRKQLEQVNSSACLGTTRTESSSPDRSAPGSSKFSADWTRRHRRRTLLLRRAFSSSSESRKHRRSRSAVGVIVGSHLVFPSGMSCAQVPRQSFVPVPNVITKRFVRTCGLQNVIYVTLGDIRNPPVQGRVL